MLAKMDTLGKYQQPRGVSAALINNRFAMAVVEDKSSGAGSSVWDTGHENVWRRLVYSRRPQSRESREREREDTTEGESEADGCRCLRWFVIH